EVIGEFCSIRLLKEDNEKFTVTGSLYHPDPEICRVAREMFLSLLQPTETGMTSSVLVLGQPLLLPSVAPQQITTHIDPKYLPFVERLGMASLLAVPLLADGKILGTISLTRSRPEHPYNEDDLRLMQDIATHAALAVTNARLLLSEREAK